MTCPSNTSALSSVGPVFGSSPISGCAGGVGVFVGVGIGSWDGVGFIPYRRPRTGTVFQRRRPQPDDRTAHVAHFTAAVYKRSSAMNKRLQIHVLENIRDNGQWTWGMATGDPVQC